MEKIYEAAGLKFRMDSWGRTAEQAAHYEIGPENETDFNVVSFWPDVKEKYPYISDDDGEYLATGAAFYKHLLDYGGMMLHSSAVVVDSKAYLFSADCGTGKSTHTEIWLRLFGDRAYILNDDKPALRREEDGWFAYGTPWSGKHDISVNARIPIGGIAMIERAEKNEIFSFSGKEAIRRILGQLNRVRDMDSRIKQMELLDKLLQEVPVWKLRCNMEDEAAIVSYEAMSGQKFKEN